MTLFFFIVGFSVPHLGFLVFTTTTLLFFHIQRSRSVRPHHKFWEIPAGARTQPFECVIRVREKPCAPLTHTHTLQFRFCVKE